MQTPEELSYEWRLWNRCANSSMSTRHDAALIGREADDAIRTLRQRAEKAEEDARRLAVDAARYRWLRARPLADDEIYIAVDSAKHPSRWGLGGDDPEGCDAAIDAARAAIGGTPQ